MRRIFLVRHAVAEDREQWSGPDDERPLTGKGQRQARAAAKAVQRELMDAPSSAARGSVAKMPIVIRTSPAARCVQTIEPLAQALRVDLIVDASLAEGRPIKLPRADGAHVICAHGDNIPQLLDRLGVAWVECRKGSVWIVDLDRDGAARMAKYLPPA